MDRLIAVCITCVLTLFPLLVVACPSGEKYCADLNGCISERQNCSDGKILSCVNMSAICDNNGTKHCVDVWNYTCGNFSCKNDTHYCPTEEKCIDMEDHCCSEREEACVEVLEYTDSFFRSKTLDSLCHLLASDDGNFTANYTELRHQNILENEMCDNNTYFCPLVLDCIATNETCDPDKVYEMDDDFEIFDKECAEYNETFCPLYMHCIPLHEDCSYRKLFDWYKAGNMSVDPYSKHCPENQTFCPLTFSCRDGCDPKDVLGNKSCNGTDEDTKCRESMDCSGNETDCKKRLGPANFTNVTDPTASGWLETCMYRKLIKSVHWMRSSECKPLAKKCKKEKCEFKCENLRHMNKTNEWMLDKIESEGNFSLWVDDCHFEVDEYMMHRCNMTMNMSCEVHELCDELKDELEQYEDGLLVNETISIGYCNITLNQTVYKICKKNRSCEIYTLCKPLIENDYNESKINETIRVEGCDITFNETVIEACNISFTSCKIEDLCPKYRKLAANHSRNSFPWKVDGCKVDFEEMEQCNVTFLEKNESCEVHELCHLLGDALERYKNDSNKNESVWVANCSVIMYRKVWETCGNLSCEISYLCKPLRKILDEEEDDFEEIMNSTIEIGTCNITLNETILDACNISMKESDCTIRKLCKRITENDYNSSMVNKSIHVKGCDIVLDNEVIKTCNISFGPSCKDLCSKFRELAKNHTKYSFPKYIGECKVYSWALEQCDVTLRDIDEYYYQMFFNGFQISDSVKKTVSHIAVRRVGVASDDGVWQYWHSEAWKPLGPVSSDRALVLESSIPLRFMANESYWHGLATLMYTPVDNGTTGSLVDVSDILHDPRHTLALLQYPSRPVANVSRLIGPTYTVNEDEEDAGFMIDDKIEMEITHTVMAKLMNANMSEYFEHLHHEIVEDYNETVKCFEDFVPAIAIIETGESSEGRWIVNGREVAPSVARPQIVTPNDRLSYLSAEHVHGNWSMKYLVAVFSNCSASVKEEYFDAPAPFAHALKGAMVLQNSSRQVKELVEDVLENMASGRTTYSLANFNGVVEILQASRAVKDAAKDIVAKAFSAVTLPNTKHLSGVPRFLHPEGQLVILNNPTVFTFDVHVLPRNDRPDIKTPRIFFPDIAYNLTTHANVGTRVKDLLTEAEASDIDNDKIGIAIVQALNSSIGSWYYKVGSGVWTQVVVDNKEYTDSLSGTVSAFFLNSSCILRFQMHDDDELWNNLEASKYAKIVFLLGDGSDGYAIGMRNITRPSEDTSAYSEKSVTAIVRRIGCDGRAGSKGKKDICMVCGGDGLSCLGCDGILNSGAIIDDCGNCTGGTTNVTFNVMKDCAKECGLSFTDDCGLCQRKDRFVNFTDCSGECFGEAVINKCGFCVGGTSGNPVTFGADVCGVCNGDNSTCLDCEEVPKGGKVRDFCGKCLFKSDSSFNNDCVKLKRIVPDSGPSLGGTKVMVQGAGLKTYSRVTCYVNGTNPRISIPSSSFELYEDGRVIEFVTPALHPGHYYIHCQFDSEDVSHQVEDVQFLVYNKSAIQYQSINPEYTDINTAQRVEIGGNGFVNTTDIACVSRDGRVFEALFVNSTNVHCKIPATKASVKLELGVSFSREDRLLGDHNITFTIYAKPSIPVGARFLDNLQGILVTFNVPTKPTAVSKSFRSQTCETFFPSNNVSLFGLEAICIFRTPKTMVIICSRASIAPNDTIMFKLASVTQRLQEVTKDPGVMYENLVVAPPTKSVVPKAVLTGTSVLGICAKLRLDGGQSSGSGGRRLTFIWGVEWDDPGDPAINSNATADLNSSRTFLSGLPDFHPIIQWSSNKEIVIGPKYKFTLRVRNFLGELSEEASLVVQRQDKSLPGLHLGARTKRMRTALGTTLQGRVKLSSCLPPGYKPKVLFTWEIQAVGINLGVTDQSRLTIPKGLLQGGRDYTLTLTAAMKSDLSLSTTSTIVLQVKSSPLKAIIKGGGSLVVGEDETFTLNGARSFDPDLSSDPASYNWRCFGENSDPCFEPDPARVGKLRRMVIPSGVKATINVADALKTNSTYTFMLIFKKGNRKSEASVTVLVKSGAPPSVLIHSISAAKVNPSDVLILESFISSKKTVNTTWSSVQSEGYGYIDLEAEGVALTPRYRKYEKEIGKARLSASPSLVIAKNKLEDDVTYKFLLTVEHSDSSSFADIEITTNAAPTLGTLEVGPPSGYFSNTTFTLKAAEGWDDDDADLPMMYQFGYYVTESGVLREEVLRSPSESNSLDVELLPQGQSANNYSLDLFVKVFDIYGAVTLQETTVIVKPILIDAAVVNKLGETVNDNFKSGDFAKGAGNANAIAAALTGSGASDVGTRRAARTFKKGVSDQVLDAVEGGGIQDKAGRDVVQGCLLQMTSDCKPDCDPARLAKVLRSMLALRQSSSRRRRRAVLVSDIEIKTGEEIATTLKIFENVIDPDDYSNSSLASKADFLSTVQSQEPSLCKGLATGGPFEVAKSNITVMRAVKDAFATVDTEFMEVSTSTAPEFFEASVMYRLGQSLKTQFESWACTNEDTCTGTCIATAQFKGDLLIQHDPAVKNMTRLSDVASLRLYNPQTLEEISVSGLASPVALRFPIEHGKIYENYTKECRTWNQGSLEWQKSGCTGYMSINDTVVECSCTQLGYVAVFLGQESLPTTRPPTQAATSAVQEATTVEFAFAAEYSQVISGNTTKSVFISYLRRFLANLLSVSQARITNIDIRSGSIIVTLTILPSNGTNEASVNATTIHLENLVKTNNVNFSLPGHNETLRVDPSSFKIIAKPTPSPTQGPDDDDDGFSTAEIVIIVVVCVVVVIAIIAALLYYCLKVKPSRAGKISPHTSHMQLNEQQNNNQLEKNSGVENNAVVTDMDHEEKAV